MCHKTFTELRTGFGKSRKHLLSLHFKRMKGSLCFVLFCFLEWGGGGLFVWDCLTSGVFFLSSLHQRGIYEKSQHSLGMIWSCSRDILCKNTRRFFTTQDASARGWTAPTTHCSLFALHAVEGVSVF